MADSPTAEAKPSRVWVVYYFGGNEPIVEEYELIEIKAHSVTVNKRSHRFTIREAHGRAFYYEKDMVVKHVKDSVKRNKESHDRKAASLQKKLDRDDYPASLIQVVPNTPYPAGKLIL